MKSLAFGVQMIKLFNLDLFAPLWTRQNLSHRFCEGPWMTCSRSSAWGRATVDIWSQRRLIAPGPARCTHCIYFSMPWTLTNILQSHSLCFSPPQRWSHSETVTRKYSWRWYWRASPPTFLMWRSGLVFGSGNGRPVGLLECCLLLLRSQANLKFDPSLWTLTVISLVEHCWINCKVCWKIAHLLS